MFFLFWVCFLAWFLWQICQNNLCHHHNPSTTPKPQGHHFCCHGIILQYSEIILRGALSVSAIVISSWEAISKSIYVCVRIHFLVVHDGFNKLQAHQPWCKMDPTTSWMGKKQGGPCWILFPTFSMYIPSPFPNLLSGGYCCLQEAVCHSLPRCGPHYHDTAWDGGETNSIPSTWSCAIGVLLRHWTSWYRYTPILPLSTLHRVWPTCPCWRIVGSAFHALRPALRSDIHTLSHRKKSMMFGWCFCLLSMRPHGKFLVLEGGHERYLLGREICLLMGMPIFRMKMDIVSDQAPWLVTIWNLSVWIYSCQVSKFIHVPKGIARFGREWNESSCHIGCTLCSFECHGAREDAPAFQLVVSA